MSDMLYQKNPTGPVTPSGGTQSAKLPANRGISADASAEVFNLTASDRVALGFGGIADFISAGSIYTQGMFESTKLELAARTLDFNKRALNRDIQDISYVTGIQASNIMKASAEMKGRQKAAQAESGFSVNETESFKAQLDYTDILAKDQIDQYAYEASMAIEGKKNQIAALEAEQKIKENEARYIRHTSRAAAGLKLVTGAAQVAAGLYL